jgi:hypothetical protein
LSAFGCLPASSTLPTTKWRGSRRRARRGALRSTSS